MQHSWNALVAAFALLFLSFAAMPASAQSSPTSSPTSTVSVRISKSGGVKFPVPAQAFYMT